MGSAETPAAASPAVNRPAAGAPPSSIPVVSRAADCAAVIYSPGLFEKEDGKSLSLFSERLARALDQQSSNVKTRYEAKPAVVETYADGRDEVEVREIVRSAPGVEPEVTHRVYFLDYQAELEAAKSEGNWLTEAWALGSTLWVMAVRYLCQGRKARSLSPSQKTATVWAGAWLAGLTLYFVWMVCEGIDALEMDPKLPPFPTGWFWSGMEWAAGVMEPFTRWWGRGWLDSFAGWVVEGAAQVDEGAGQIAEWLEEWDGWLVTAGLGALSFTRVWAGLARGVNLFLMTARYFIAGRGRAACTGRFHNLLEHVAEENAGRIDVVGYSMGSLVALDALFPWAGMPRGRGERVRSLTTIGCPFDFVRAFWPGYFEGRDRGAPGTRWVNVFSPVDLLGSNFVNAHGALTEPRRGINAASPDEDESEAGAPGAKSGEGVRPALSVVYDHLGRTRLRWTDALTFEAFSAHSQYWVRGDARADSCLGAVVVAVYGADAI